MTRRTKNRNRHETPDLVPMLDSTLQKMQDFTKSMDAELHNIYLRGSHLLKRWEEERGKAGDRPEGRQNRVTFGVDRASRQLLAEAAAKMKVEVKWLKEQVKFAESVNLIENNCGQGSFRALFCSRSQQTVKAIRQLSRTSDVRQRYRVEGVLSGRFRSIAPQCGDPVFDTVSFGEVPSRLARASGQVGKWATENKSVWKSELVEVRQAVGLCHSSAMSLRSLVTDGTRAGRPFPKSIERETAVAAFASMTVRGRIIGPLKAAFKLIAKNVWDFPEMQHRGIVPTPEERTKSLDWISSILDTTTKLKSRLKKK